MGTCRDVVGDPHGGHISHAAKCDHALTVLRGLFGISVIELACGARNRAKIFLDELKALRFIEFTGHDEHHIVWLVEFPVESAQVLHRYALDVAAIANG